MELQSGPCLDEAAYNCREGVDIRRLSGWVCNLIPYSFPLMIMFEVCTALCKRLCRRRQMMLLFITFSQNHLHAVHFLVVSLRLMGFLPLTAPELTPVSSRVCKYRFMSNQSCHSLPTWPESHCFLGWNCTIIAPHVRIVFDGCHLLSIFPGRR